MTTPEQALARVAEVQATYRQWLALQPQLQAAQQTWQDSVALMRQLEAFYFGDEFAELREVVEQHQLQLPPSEEYSVLGEDTLWNAFGDQQTMAWQRLRTALAVVDPEQRTQA